MADDPQEPTPPSRASPQTQLWVERRRETRKAIVADRERARSQRRAEPDEPNRVAFLLGLVVVGVLCVVGWFIIDQMRCNPLFSNVSFAQADKCH